MYQQLLDTFVCDYCDRSFTRKYNLRAHIENCHINLICKCDVCDQKFGTPAGLQLHLSRGHNRLGEPYPECDECGRIFTRKQNITSHMITVHLQGNGEDIRCKSCNKTFTSERNLRRHINVLHNPNYELPTCHYCSKIFKRKHLLISHIEMVHVNSKEIKCNMCDRSYINNRNLRRHIEMFHGKKDEYKCEACPKVYTSNQSLKRHVRTSHNQAEECKPKVYESDNIYNAMFTCQENQSDVDESANYKCPACNKGFKEEPLLRQHVKTSHEFTVFYKYCKNSLLKSTFNQNQKGMFNCEFCYNAFEHVYEFKSHLSLLHSKEYWPSSCNVCFAKFYTKESRLDHKKVCITPIDAHACSHCDKLFTDVSSLEFHTRIFHPPTQLADSVTNEHADTAGGNFLCKHCDRVYYSHRSLKHHVKLKHTTNIAVECEICGKICCNKYYLLSHMKMVHNNDTWSKCDYCDKQFKSKRNIRRHIEYTHMGMQRYKCIECETLFKEKRSLRKHVRSKHPNSTLFPQCHICYKRFESAKSCKIHLKLIHSFNLNTYPCDLCSVSFNSNESLQNHLKTKHLSDKIYKCEDCNLVLNGFEKFEEHKEVFHANLLLKTNQKDLPKCILCDKDFSTMKTLKRHIKRFHDNFDVDDLANYGTKNRSLIIDCEDCLKYFNDDHYINLHQNLKNSSKCIIFSCDTCSFMCSSLEFAIQRYKTSEFDKNNMILSEFCTTEMSDGGNSEAECMEPESTVDIKEEPIEIYEVSDCEIKDEPMSP